MSALSIMAHCALAASSLWGNDVQGKYSEVSPTTAKLLQSLQCHDGPLRKCADLEHFGEAAVMGGMFYTLRISGLIFTNPTVHGFDLSTGKVKHVVKLHQLKGHLGNFAPGVWGLAADVARGRILAIGPISKPDPSLGLRTGRPGTARPWAWAGLGPRRARCRLVFCIHLVHLE